MILVIGPIVTMTGWGVHPGYYICKFITCFFLGEGMNPERPQESIMHYPIQSGPGGAYYDTVPSSWGTQLRLLNWVRGDWGVGIWGPRIRDEASGSRVLGVCVWGFRDQIVRGQGLGEGKSLWLGRGNKSPNDRKGCGDLRASASISGFRV